MLISLFAILIYAGDKYKGNQLCYPVEAFSPIGQLGPDVGLSTGLTV